MSWQLKLTGGFTDSLNFFLQLESNPVHNFAMAVTHYQAHAPISPQEGKSA